MYKTPKKYFLLLMCEVAPQYTYKKSQGKARATSQNVMNDGQVFNNWYNSKSSESTVGQLLDNNIFGELIEDVKDVKVRHSSTGKSSSNNTTRNQVDKSVGMQNDEGKEADLSKAYLKKVKEEYNGRNKANRRTNTEIQQGNEIPFSSEMENPRTGGTGNTREQGRGTGFSSDLGSNVQATRESEQLKLDFISR